MQESEFQFYPTPIPLITQLIAPYRGKYNRVLEPSAGRGDIADQLAKWNSTYYRTDIDVCEISADHRAILASKGYRVIGTDFLTLVAPYLYGAILMNPPFANGAQHVLKAWNMLVDGGELASVLPESVIQKETGLYPELNRLIEFYGKVEPVGAAFKSAERKTDVDCVIVRLTKPVSRKFQPFSGFTPKRDAEYQEPEARQLPVSRDMIQAIIAQYQASMMALKTYHEAEILFRSLTPKNVFKEDNPIPSYLELVDKTKEAFWTLIFERTKLGEITTTAFQKDFMTKRAALSRMEFSQETIFEVLHTFMQNRELILDECVLDVFRQITGCSRDNLIKSEAWATNKGWKIGKKIIVPRGLSFYGNWQLDYETGRFVDDIDKVLVMFGGQNGVISAKAIEDHLTLIRTGKAAYTDKFETPNFFVRVYKKRTLHLWFKDLVSLEALNRYAGEKQMFVLGSGK